MYLQRHPLRSDGLLITLHSRRSPTHMITAPLGTCDVQVLGDLSTFVSLNAAIQIVQ